MGQDRIKYPIGEQDFKSLIEGGFVYVDKTQYVYELTHSNKYYFLSRPRRFGKSLLISTLRYYFEGRKMDYPRLKVCLIKVAPQTSYAGKLTQLTL